MGAHGEAKQGDAALDVRGAITILEALRGTDDNPAVINKNDQAVAYLDGLTYNNIKTLLKNCPDNIWDMLLEEDVYAEQGGDQKEANPSSGKTPRLGKRKKKKKKSKE